MGRAPVTLTLAPLLALLAAAPAPDVRDVLKHPRQLTSIGENGEAYFSPDGKELLFQSHGRPAHFATQIYLFDLEKNEERRVVFDDGDDTCSAWNPDGSGIIYASSADELRENSLYDNLKPANREAATKAGKAPSGHHRYAWQFLPFEIYAAKLDARHERARVTKRLTHSRDYDAEGTFSPDGKQIVFTSKRDGDLELYRMNADGSGQTRITFAPGYDGGAFISPDGKHLIWRAARGHSGALNLYYSDLDGRHARQLTHDAKAVNWCPFFLPDGKRVVFSSNRADPKNFDLYTLDIGGTCLKRLTYSAGADILPALSADGKKIVWTSTRAGGKAQLFVADFAEPSGCTATLPGATEANVTTPPKPASPHQH